MRVSGSAGVQTCDTFRRSSRLSMILHRLTSCGLPVLKGAVPPSPHMDTKGRGTEGGEGGDTGREEEEEREEGEEGEVSMGVGPLE